MCPARFAASRRTMALLHGAPGSEVTDDGANPRYVPVAVSLGTLAPERCCAARRIPLPLPRTTQRVPRCACDMPSTATTIF
jgi:hypothetical protein